MIFISHRGNTIGPAPSKENREEYIDVALTRGYDVEIDVFKKNDRLWLGHDDSRYPTTLAFLKKRKKKLWIHCKNLEALAAMLEEKDLNCFWHEKDAHTLTSKGYIWTYPGYAVSQKSVLVMKNYSCELPACFGICSDYVGTYS